MLGHGQCGTANRKTRGGAATPDRQGRSRPTEISAPTAAFHAWPTPKRVPAPASLLHRTTPNWKGVPMAGYGKKWAMRPSSASSGAATGLATRAQHRAPNGPASPQPSQSRLCAPASLMLSSRWPRTLRIAGRRKPPSSRSPRRSQRRGHAHGLRPGGGCGGACPGPGL